MQTIKHRMDKQQGPMYHRELYTCLPGSSEESACNAEDLSLIPGLGITPGKGNSNPLHYLCLENSRDGGAWWATVHGAAKRPTLCNTQ